MDDSSYKIEYAPEDLSSLALKYGVSTLIMRYWLDDIGVVVKHKRVYTPKEVKQIIDHLGPPIS